MFSERLEKLIQSSLQDGILTDQEKTAIIKRAKAEGEDIDEVEIYIDSLLQKRQKELNNSVIKKQAKTSSMDELKKLIDAAMADGIITSKEREVIIRKAATLGIDAAEVEVYLDAEIQKTEQAADMAKRDKIGPVCPQCGKQVPPLTLKCDCGYEFTKGSHVSSIQLFFEKINNIQLSQAEIDSCSDVVEEKRGSSYYPVKDANGNIVKKVDEQKVSELKKKKETDIISSFPVPNTKEDIIEFLSLAAPNSKTKGGLWGTITGRIKIFSILVVIVVILCLIPICIDAGWLQILLPLGGCGVFFCAMAFFTGFEDVIEYNKRANVWRTKFEQVLMKGRSLRGDSDFQQQLDYYENMVEN